MTRVSCPSCRLRFGAAATAILSTCPECGRHLEATASAEETLGFSLVRADRRAAHPADGRRGRRADRRSAHRARLSATPEARRPRAGGPRRAHASAASAPPPDRRRRPARIHPRAREPRATCRRDLSPANARLARPRRPPTAPTGMHLVTASSPNTRRDRSEIEKRPPPAAPSMAAMDITATSGATMTGSATQGIKTVLHPVSDLAKAKAVYAALLGVPPQADESYYVGFEAAGQHVGLVPGGGPQGMTSPVAYWEVPDIEAKLAEVTAAGATVKDPARDVGGGRLVATVTDPDGNVLGLLQDPAEPGPRHGSRRRRPGDTMSTATRTDAQSPATAGCRQPRPDPRAGRAREQPQGHQPRDPETPADGVHRRLRLGQELAGVRHDRRGVAAPHQRDLQRLRAGLHADARAARGRRARRADDRDPRRPGADGLQPPLHRRHRHRRRRDAAHPLQPARAAAHRLARRVLVQRRVRPRERRDHGPAREQDPNREGELQPRRRHVPAL